MPAKRMTIAAAMKMGAVLPDVERTTTWGAPTLKVAIVADPARRPSRSAAHGMRVRPLAGEEEIVAPRQPGAR
ncbi:MAG TPA: hypothetical protein VM819_17895 [Vicinamibacterales bacterium]|nr:hypothetical protein [Vicinamibacterales bacterium]